MPRFRAALLLAAAALGACSPTFNWREVRVDPAPLRAMLPCKPDHGSRVVAMGPRRVELAVTGCDAGGATFAVLQADLGDPGAVDEALRNWNRATLANLHAPEGRSQPFLPPGATPLPSSVRVSASGQRADGTAVRGEAAYFARGSSVFQAVVYAADPKPEAVQTFFDGLKFE
ncbi:hypothetical protein [Ramlibacter humi]|uniref:DUF1795 domain-containing protein n=1 Tax=Ramlibacter humi TaxID=2530451 RepID=A0A4Z0BHZ2_9BURK|nr:hypothetical protein [Ramlibacter humi]TFY98400.1 hypothetical protein EZ216_17590 [Ramlibacter humi]